MIVWIMMDGIEVGCLMNLVCEMSSFCVCTRAKIVSAKNWIWDGMILQKLRSRFAQLALCRIIAQDFIRKIAQDFF